MLCLALLLSFSALHQDLPGLAAVLATAATCLVLAILIVRRWQVRRWDALGYDISGACEVRLYNRIRRCFGKSLNHSTPSEMHVL